LALLNVQLIQIAHNPGTIPDDDRLFSDADLIVVFDNSYNVYTGSKSLQSELAQLPSRDIYNYTRQNFSYIFTGVPSNWSSNDLQGFVNNVKSGAQWLFVTDSVASNNGSLFEEWGNWNEFVQVIG
jgi:hypothetical protein